MPCQPGSSCQINNADQWHVSAYVIPVGESWSQARGGSESFEMEDSGCLSVPQKATKGCNGRLGMRHGRKRNCFSSKNGTQAVTYTIASLRVGRVSLPPKCLAAQDVPHLTPMHCHISQLDYRLDSHSSQSVVLYRTHSAAASSRHPIPPFSRDNKQHSPRPTPLHATYE